MTISAMTSQRTVKIEVHGIVQGVFYRRTLAELANDLGIVGSVRNQKDGSVLVVAQGDELPLTNFINYCKQGNNMSRVDAIEVEDIAAFKAQKFEIL